MGNVGRKDSVSQSFEGSFLGDFEAHHVRLMTFLGPTSSALPLRVAGEQCRQVSNSSLVPE